MARNVELKARIDSVDALMPKVSALPVSGPFEIVQNDTFFICNRGRLKLRSSSTGEDELIYYQRQDERAPTESRYHRVPVQAPLRLQEILSMAYGEAGHVHKHRTLFLYGRTRIHLDRVTGLGDFLELEVVLEDGESPETGAQEAENILSQLGVNRAQLVEKAYVDLIGILNPQP